VLNTATPTPPATLPGPAAYLPEHLHLPIQMPTCHLQKRPTPPHAKELTKMSFWTNYLAIALMRLSMAALVEA